MMRKSRGKEFTVRRRVVERRRRSKVAPSQPLRFPGASPAERGLSMCAKLNDLES